MAYSVPRPFMFAAHPSVSVGHIAGANACLLIDFCMTRSEKWTEHMCLSFPRSNMSNSMNPRLKSLPDRRSLRARMMFGTTLSMYLWTLDFQLTPREASIADWYRLSRSAMDSSVHPSIRAERFAALLLSRRSRRAARRSSEFMGGTPNGFMRHPQAA